MWVWVHAHVGPPAAAASVCGLPPCVAVVAVCVGSAHVCVVVDVAISLLLLKMCAAAPQLCGLPPAVRQPGAARTQLCGGRTATWPAAPARWPTWWCCPVPRAAAGVWRHMSAPLAGAAALMVWWALLLVRSCWLLSVGGRACDGGPFAARLWKPDVLVTASNWHLLACFWTDCCVQWLDRAGQWWLGVGCWH